MSSPECAAAFIFDPAGRMFVQRRSATRGLFPHCWDIVGGHLEPGETPEQALRREVSEETGWEVLTIHAALAPVMFTGDDGIERREHDYVITVDGDLDAPSLEPTKTDDWRWITAVEVSDLDRDGRLGDKMIVDLIQAGFEAAQEVGLSPGYAEVIAPLVDKAFRAVMAAARERGGRELVTRHGLPSAGPLIDYRSILPWRPLTPTDRNAVNRYADPAALHAGFLEQQRLGTVTVAADETVTATERGVAFYADLWRLHDDVAMAMLQDMPELYPVLNNAAPGPAFSAVHPAPLPDGASAALHAFAGLSALRYQRADAHAAAWSAAGLTAAEMVALPAGPQRDAIEAETNRLAGHPYRALTTAQRFSLLDRLSGR